MQRSTSLIPLSHDHHHGLVVSRHIQQGLRRNINPGRIIAYVRDFWQRDLQHHFAEEETIIFPLLPENDSLLLRAKEEHQSIRGLLESFSADAASSASALNAFAKLLETHIRFEERMLFPHIEQLASEAMLEQAGKKLQKEAPVTKSDWPDSFWIE